MIDFLIDYSLLIIVLIFLAVASWAILVFLKFQRNLSERSNSIKRISKKLGMEFLGRQSGFSELISSRVEDSMLILIHDRLERASSAGRRSSIIMKNICHLELENGNLFFFDYVFNSWPKDTKKRSDEMETFTERNTFVFANLEDRDFPRLLIRPAGLTQKLLSLLGVSEIQLRSNSPIASKYRVSGAEDARIIELLDETLLANAIVLRDDFCVEAWDSNLLITLDKEIGRSFLIDTGSQDGRIGVADIAELEEFVENSIELAKCFAKSHD